MQVFTHEFGWEFQQDEVVSSFHSSSLCSYELFMSLAVLLWLTVDYGGALCLNQEHTPVMQRHHALTS